MDGRGGRFIRNQALVPPAAFRGLPLAVAARAGKLDAVDRMEESARNTAPDLEHLPGITFRQLEVFMAVCRERSYTHAAGELHSSRTNVKRVCRDFEQAVGRPLFEEGEDRQLRPTPFAVGLQTRVIPLSRALRRLGEGVRGLHEEGRTLRFAAAGEFFRGGLFTDFLSRLKVADRFRPCFLRIEGKRFRTALLNAECDVYCGIGLASSERLDAVDLGPVPWKIVAPAESPPLSGPADLCGRDWHLLEAGDPEAAAELLERFRAAGATGGAIVGEAPAKGGQAPLTFVPDTTRAIAAEVFPAYRFLAVMRRNHPYAELKARLEAAARPSTAHGH